MQYNNLNVKKVVFRQYTGHSLFSCSFFVCIVVHIVVVLATELNSKKEVYVNNEYSKADQGGWIQVIHEIAPHFLNNSFIKVNRAQIGPDSVFFTFRGGKVLVCSENGKLSLPVIRQLQGYACELIDHAIYAFSVDASPMSLISEKAMADRIPEGTPEGMEYVDIRELYDSQERWPALAAVTARHLDHWYGEHRYCGCCGSLMEHSNTERAMICPECRNIQYPRISPVIMAAVTDGDRLLVTRYAGRPYKGLALIAGFVEIGESVEGALQREVMEEVGLKVKELKYFGSQPWGFSDSLITGFFASLDGSDIVTVDRSELSEAVWMRRDELPQMKNDMSITAVMIEAFRKGEI